MQERDENSEDEFRSFAHKLLSWHELLCLVPKLPLVQKTLKITYACKIFKQKIVAQIILCA